MFLVLVMYMIEVIYIIKDIFLVCYFVIVVMLNNFKGCIIFLMYENRN